MHPIIPSTRSEIIELIIQTSISPVLVPSPSPSPAPNNQPTINLSSIFREKAKRSLKPILTKFHAGYFRITLSLGIQTLLWKNLTEQDGYPLHHTIHTILHPTGFLVFWSVSLCLLFLLSLIYVLRCIFFFNMVKSEFSNHVAVNYLFAPWISWLLLLQSAPFLPPNTLSYLVLWWAFAAPVVALDVKIYGQWFTKGKRFLSTVANPTSQLSVIGNLVGAQAAANMGWKESAVCLFSLGMVHYLVLFVTLYQRLSGGNRIPAILRPVFFLFFAAPSVASLAWKSIVGAFDTTSKMLFLLSLFLFTSLVFRPALFKRSMRRFSVAWWAYSFPLTVLALASAEYAREVKGCVSHALMFILLVVSVVVTVALFVCTLLNTKMLLPDDDPTAHLISRYHSRA
ncbi:S-type anion channel SLAH1 [Linum grandiflorum]